LIAVEDELELALGIDVASDGFGLRGVLHGVLHGVGHVMHSWRKDLSVA
jgi:hypothetical protein